MLVDLVCQLDPALVPSTVAGVLGLELGGEEITPESIARAIRERKLLLVLDNCEHVVDAVARLAETILRLCPAASIIATSREVLRIEGEYVYRVPPLDVPSQDEEEADVVLGYGAVQLLITRANALDSEFRPQGESLRAVAAICRRLDGIPLAIEFAAARAAVFGPELVISNLEKRLGLLGGGRRTALPRHQTLRATLDWSYDLLPEPEQCVLRRLGVFAAGFTLEAVNAVMSDKGHAAPFLLEQIASLVAKSLVTLDRSAPTGRWRLLDTTRDYALEKLAENGETALVARRCVEYFRDLVRPAMYGSKVQPTDDDMARYAREIDNVRACLDWSFSRGDAATGVVLTAAYAPVWLSLFLVAECRERIERAVEYLESDSQLNTVLTMQLHVSLGFALIFSMGSVARTRAVLVRALETAEKLDEVSAMLEILFALYGVYHNCGECREALAAAERFSRVAHRTGDPVFAPMAYRMIGNCLHYAGKQLEAQRSFERMLEVYVAPEYQRHAIWSSYDQRVMGEARLAQVLWLRGFVDQGVAKTQASLEEARAAGHKPTLCWVLHYGAYPVALMTGDLDAAGQAVAMLADLASSISAPIWKILAQCMEGKLLIKRGEFRAGSAMLRAALDTCERTEHTICYPEFLGALAEGLVGLGRFAEALATLDRALAMADRGGERWFVPELLRTKGELLLRGASDQAISAAEDCFSDGIAIAREHDALSLELRIALSLARLRIGQDRHNEARQLLAPVYNKFTEGFETPDLRSAGALLRSSPSCLPLSTT